MLTPRKPLGIFLVTVLGAVLFLHACWFFASRGDDAYVLLRYATGISRGNGWVFNAGERVEGFMSPLLVFLQSIVLNFDGDGLWWTKALGLVATALTLLATLHIARQLDGSATSWILAGAMLALSTPFVLASVNGMETLPFTACVAWGLALSQSNEKRWRILAGLLLGLSTLFRPEGVIALACVLLITIIERKWIALSLCWAVVALPMLAWRWFYFTSPWTNVYLARVVPQAVNRWDSGIDYLTHWGLTPALVVGAVALLLLSLKVVEARLFALFVLAWGAYVIWTAGDPMQQGRLLVPMIPALAVGVGAGVAQLGQYIFRAQAEPARWTAGLALLFALACVPSAWANSNDAHRQMLALNNGVLGQREQLADWLHDITQPQDVVVANVPGELAYVAHLHVIDTSGATDPTVAEMLHDSAGQYESYTLVPDPATAHAIAKDVLSRHPDLIVLEINGVPPALAAEKSPVIKSTSRQDSAFIEDPAFKTEYEYVCQLPAELVGGEKYAFNLFAKKGYKPRQPPTVLPDGSVLCESTPERLTATASR